MSKLAWVTLTTNDTYSLGALVLAHSLRRAGTQHQLAVLVTPGVSEAMRDRLKAVYNVVQEVNVMDSQDSANLALLSRPELGITFTKLHCWRLVQFEKCVFLDSDTLVLQNCDELFEREELSAAPDVSWPDCFNSGVFVYKPSQETFDKIVEFALKNGSFDGGDQGLLNQYFPDWATADIKKRLPFLYNVTAYASYCYLPAFKQFRDKIKILHFAGKMKPWLIPFNSENKTPSIPTDYAHAADLIQLWWNIFFDNVHQNLNDNMRFFLPNLVSWKNNYDENNLRKYYEYEEQQKQQQQHQLEYQYCHESSHDTNYTHSDSSNDNKIVFHDPWEDFYRKQEIEEMQRQQQEMQRQQQEMQRQQQEMQRQQEEAQRQQELQRQQEQEQQQQQQQREYVHKSKENQNNIIENISHVEQSQEWKQQQVAEEKHFEVENKEEEHKANVIEFKPAVQISEDISWKVSEEEEEEEEKHWTRDDKSHKSDNIHENELTENFEPTLTDTQPNISENNINMLLENTKTSCSLSNETVETGDNLNTASQLNSNDAPQEAGLAGAISHIRLGEPRTPEQEAYEQLMRRQCWESGQVDYSGRDSFDNIWKKITQTLESKPDNNETEMLTSADIEHGKVEYDPKTGASTEYRVIDGGYEVITTTPQPNGTIKTSKRTFWDPKPVSEEDMLKQQENRKQIQKRMNKEIRIDERTTMLTRAIEGGYEEVYTTINEDGTKSVKTKTFFDAVPEGTPFPDQAQQPKPPGNKKIITRKTSVESNDSSDNRKLVQRVNTNQQIQNVQQSSNVQQQSTYQETRRTSQTIETTENNRTVRKNSLQTEQNIRQVNSSNVTDGKDNTKAKKTKKPKSSAPPPPADFVQNDSTTVSTKRVPGGVEYIYSTQLESGKTITTSKTVYEEEEVELTEEEIKQYKKTLKDAEKHKNVTTTKKLKSESGTKKVVPSENPGDVTTVETIRIDGGTEYHYTTVTAEGIVKKAVKTVYDPVPCSNPDDTEEEEIVEEYEEEIIEPGEKNIRTIETVKTLPRKFEEQVTIETHEKKEKKTKRSMVISH